MPIGPSWSARNRARRGRNSARGTAAKAARTASMGPLNHRRSLTRMSTGASGAVRPVVFRQSSAVLVPVGVWLFCFLATADAVVEGTAGYAVEVAVLMAAISFAVWLILASPCLVVETDGVRV